MTSLSPEAVAQMVADHEAGTPGPWHFDGPVWNQIIWTDGENRLCFMAHSNGLNDDRDIANARRIARLPDLEAAYLTLAAENATLRADNHMVTIQRAEVVERLMDDIATLRASEAAALERVKVLTDLMQWAYDTLGEINLSNYGHDDVCNLNDKSVEVIFALEAALTPTADKEPKT